MQAILMAISPNARIALVTTALQDKAGSIELKSAELFRLRGGKWLGVGRGRTLRWK